MRGIMKTYLQPGSLYLLRQIFAGRNTQKTECGKSKDKPKLGPKGKKKQAGLRLRLRVRGSELRLSIILYASA